MSLSRRLLWLNGTAIIAVAVHHAAAYSLQAMFLWTDRYMDVSVPNFDQLGTTAYYVLMVLRQLLTFAGAAFFVISGYFVGITARGSSKANNWTMATSRVKLLIAPFLIWTAVRYILLRQIPRSLDDILTPLHWIPLLIQFYLLSPIIVAVAQRHWKLLLLGIILFGQTMTLFGYLATFGNAPAVQLQTVLPNWFFLVNMPLWFPLGVVIGLHYVSFKPWLVRYRRHLLAAVVLMAILVLAEYAVVDHLNGPQWLGPNFSGFTKLPYSLFFILAFLGYEKSRMPLAGEVVNVGTKSLGIYLLNINSIYIVAVLMYRLTPMILGYQLIYLAILIFVGLALPLLLMGIVRRSPVRHRYRLLFG